MKNKNELQYEMIKPKRQGKLKLDTKEVRIVQKTKLRQELKDREQVRNVSAEFYI